MDTDLNVSRIEYSKVDMSLTSLAILCEYYDISLGEFFNSLDDR